MLGLRAVCRVAVGESELAKVAASPLVITGTRWETLGVVPRTGLGLGDGTNGGPRSLLWEPVSSRPLVICGEHSRALPPLPAFPSPWASAPEEGHVGPEARVCVHPCVCVGEKASEPGSGAE